MMFPDGFFEPVPTKKDLVWGNYLHVSLREEVFELFDRMAHLQYKVLPQRINPQNAVDPIYNLTLQLLSWPDKEERAKCLKLPRSKAIAKMAKIEGQAKLEKAKSDKARLAQVSQSQDTTKETIVDSEDEMQRAKDDQDNVKAMVEPPAANEKLVVVMVTGDIYCRARL